MNLAVIGSGYVGLVSGVCFAEMGNNVICVDVDSKKIEMLKAAQVPIFEPGLDEMLARNIKSKNISFSTDLSEALHNCDIVFIAVGTPSGEDGSADLQYVLNAARQIGEQMSGDLLVVDKSTVPVGTAELVKAEIQKALLARFSSDLDSIKTDSIDTNAKDSIKDIESAFKKAKIPFTFSVASNPEFLKEGDAINDFLRPDRIVIGADEPHSLELLRELYAPFMQKRDKILCMDIKSAEMTKYAANAMLATKISFINEIANLCEALGANVNAVRAGIGSDSRIGYSFIYPGCGFGGSCFPKDVKALAKMAKDAKISSELIDSVQNVNYNQKQILSKKVLARFGSDLSGFCFCVWGLAFKPQTDDMREAPSIDLISTLCAAGAKIKAYDPQATDNAKAVLQGLCVEYCSEKYEAALNADAIILLTEWKEFKSPDFKRLSRELKHKIIFDGRNQYNTERLAKIGFEYHQIGLKTSFFVDIKK